MWNFGFGVCFFIRALKCNPCAECICDPKRASAAVAVVADSCLCAWWKPREVDF